MELMYYYAAYFKSAAPQFATISRFLILENFVHRILKTGGVCNWGGIRVLIFVMTLFAFLRMLAVQFIIMLTSSYDGFRKWICFR